MEKSNVIISIIIVVCVAAGVAAYGLTNSDNAIFSDLAGLGSGSGDGNGLNSSNSTGININTENGGSGSSASSGSGSGSSGGSSSGGGSHPSSKITKTQAKKIANEHILEAGCYAGTPVDTGSYYNVPILNSNGKTVGFLEISYSGKVLGGGGGA